MMTKLLFRQGGLRTIMSLTRLLSYERARMFAQVMAPTFAALILLYLYTAKGGVSAFGLPLFTDFLSFWGAGQLAATGQAATVYQMEPLRSAYQAVLITSDLLPFHYPPFFLLILGPLAKLPYLAAYALFSIASIALLLRAAQTLLPDKADVPLFCLAAPAVFICVMQGQSSILCAALLTAGLYLSLSNHRGESFASGMVLALACFKPHFAVLAIALLVLKLRWTALLGWFTGLVLLISLTLLLFGPAVWLAFFNNIPFATEVLQGGMAGFEKMQSAFSGLRLLGASPAEAWSGHVLLALLCLYKAVPVLLRSTDTGETIALTLLLTTALVPFQFAYDLPILLPVLMLWLNRQKANFSAGDRLLLLGLWLWPALGLILAPRGLPLYPLLLLGLLYRMTRGDQRQQDQA